MAGTDPEAFYLTAGDLVTGDVLETYDIVFAQQIKSFVNYDIGLPILSTRDSTGYHPAAPKEHITVIKVITGSLRRPIVLHNGRICILFPSFTTKFRRV